MTTISHERAEQIIDLLYELNSQNQAHYDHFTPGGLKKKEDEIYELIAYLEMQKEGD